MFNQSDKEMQIPERDAMYLSCILANHSFVNGTLQSFMNELKDIFEDIAERKNIHNYVDGHGYFVVSVKVETLQED